MPAMEREAQAVSVPVLVAAHLLLPSGAGVRAAPEEQTAHSPANTLTEKWWGNGQSPSAKQPSHTASGDAGGGVAMLLTSTSPRSPFQLMGR